MRVKSNNSSYAVYLWILTGFFLLLEVSYFIQCNSGYLSDYTYVSRNLHIPPRIFIAVAGFIAAQLGVHGGYTLIVIAATSAWLKECINLRPHALSLGILIWMVGIFTILLGNRYYFPNSKFSLLLATFISSDNIVKVIFFFFLSCFVILLIPIVMRCLRALNRVKKWQVGLWISLVVMGGGVYERLSVESLAQPSALPNIFIIGIDSLRPDFLSFFQGEAETPFLDQFLSEATVFSDAVTPLARTFPSWSSILTGRYPKELAIRSDLSDYKKVDLSSSLAHLLKEQGYQTIYATDETRFSNIDQRFGFDEVITPPIGLPDFLIGTFNDFPLSNLLINTPLGKWLFPFSYSNRAVFHTYEPDTFLSLIKANFYPDKHKPVFFVSHFCLTHYPYLWASYSSSNTSIWERYLATINRVDEQISSFMSYLSDKKLLQHAMVIILSDHGEALEFSGDRITLASSFTGGESHSPAPVFYPPSLHDEAMDQSAGHGTDVLGLTQYHSLLAIKIYDTRFPQKQAVIPDLVSLVDIQPTVLAYVSPQEKPLSASSGYSLLSAIQDGVFRSNLRHIFLESDYSPASIRTVYPETRTVLLEGVALFQIDPVSLRLTMKEKMSHMIIQSKQYADIYGEWMLALYPQGKNLRMPILINLRTGAWTNDLYSPLALHSPAFSMLLALQTFYASDL